MTKEMPMEYQQCMLCPRLCGVNRAEGERGYCGMADRAKVAHAMLHLWEEPFLSGKEGSGTVFFSGCSLGCVYCQNAKISSGAVGQDMNESELASLYLSLAHAGANNINLVTAAHFLPHVIASVALAREKGLSLPIIYNTSGYERRESIQALEQTVNIYLTDFRYSKAQTAKKYSNAPDYPEVSIAALRQMVKQTGAPVFDQRGMMERGVVVRLLLLPTHLIEAKMILKRVYEEFGDDVYISLMSQYTPMAGLDRFPNLARRVTETEYRSLVEYAQGLGVKNALIQEGETAKESFIPDFDPITLQHMDF